MSDESFINLLNKYWVIISILLLIYLIWYQQQSRI